MTRARARATARAIGVVFVVAACSPKAVDVTRRRAESDAEAEAPTSVPAAPHATARPANGGAIFVAEAQGTGGMLTRIAGAADADKPSLRTTRLAAFDGAPRAIVLDATHCYLTTALKLLRIPRIRGELETVTIGVDFE